MIKSNINDYTVTAKLDDSTDNRIWYKAVINSDNEIIDAITTDLSIEQPNNNELQESDVLSLRDTENIPKFKFVNGAIVDNDNLNELKKQRIEKIDSKTREIISLGVSHNNEIFSMSSNAQKNWTAIELRKSALSFPFSVTTIDDKEYQFTDLQDLEIFIDKVFNLVALQRSIGRALKIQINNTTTRSDIDLVVDNR